MALPYAMGIGELDPYCTKLLAFFTLERETYRFNELKRQLKGMSMEMTTPTLVLHLNHLIKKEVIVRDEKDKLNVTCRFNWEKWQDADQHMKDRIVFEKMLQKEMDEFSSRPVIEQILYVHNTAVLVFFKSIRERILAKAEPEKEFMANINFIHFANILDKAQDMLLDNVEKQGEKYATECLIIIDRLTTQFAMAQTHLEKQQVMRIPTVQISGAALNVLNRIHTAVNKDKIPEEHTLKPDIIHLALVEYGKKLGIIKMPEIPE